MFFFLGFYCPKSTEYGEQWPCEKGTFNNETGAQSSDACQKCLAGFYCDVKNLTAPVDLCQEGFYCPSLFKCYIKNSLHKYFNDTI